MTITNQNFEMYSGESKNLVINVRDDSTGNVVDLTGATIKWKLTYTNGTLIKETTNSGITITNPTMGNFTVELVPSDTSSISGTFPHGVQLIDANGNESTILVGAAKIKKPIV